jgi:Na+/melibiose symporter-like transporter
MSQYDVLLFIFVFVATALSVRHGYSRPITLVGSGLLVIGSVVALFAPPNNTVWFVVVMCFFAAGLGCMLIGLVTTMVRRIRRR